MVRPIYGSLGVTVKEVLRRIRNCMKLWKCLEGTLCAGRLFVLTLAKDDCSVGPWYKMLPKALIP